MLNSTPIDRMGLCSTCNNSPECGYRMARGFDAIYCELFDSYSPPSRDQKYNPPVRVISDYGLGGESKANGFKGLCVNCENRGECLLPKPEGGIWHCEEYS